MKVTNYQNATIDPFGKGLGMVPGTSIQLGWTRRASNGICSRKT